MLTPTDCDIRFANHARQIARLNENAWIYGNPEVGTWTSFRDRLGSILVALGTRVAAVPLDTPANSSTAGREWA